MTQADSVHSTPPTNTSRSRRAVLAGIASAAALPIAAASPAIPTARAATDPIFAAIDAFRRADALCVAVHGNIPDQVGDRRHEAYLAVLRTRPIAPAGLAALTNWAREQADWYRANSTIFPDEDLCALTAAIDDATAALVKEIAA